MVSLCVIKDGFHFAFELGNIYRKINGGIVDLGNIGTKIEHKYMENIA